MSGLHEEDRRLVESARARAAACAEVLDTANADLLVRLADSLELLLSELGSVQAELVTTKARLDGTAMAIPTLVAQARARAFDEVTLTFDVLSWQCDGQGSSDREVTRIRSMVYEARDRKPPKEG